MKSCSAESRAGKLVLAGDPRERLKRRLAHGLAVERPLSEAAQSRQTRGPLGGRQWHGGPAPALAIDLVVAVPAPGVKQPDVLAQFTAEEPRRGAETA